MPVLLTDAADMNVHTPEIGLHCQMAMWPDLVPAATSVKGCS